MLGGDGGVGKSLLSQMLLTAAAIGKPWLGFPIATVKCLGVFCEDDEDELHIRQAAINRHFNCEFGDLENLNLISRVGQDCLLMEFESFQSHGTPMPLYSQLLGRAKEFGAQLIVLDSLHDLFAGNENSRPQARQFVNLLRQMAIEVDGVVILTAHPSLTGLSSGSGMSGSTAWNNAVRSRLYLTRPKDGDPSDARVLKIMKSNYSRVGDEIRLRWGDGVLAREDLDDGVLGNIKDRNVERLFLELLDKRNKENRPVSHRPRADNYAPRVFAKHPNREGHAKKAFERAMEQLFAQDRIVVESYGDRPSRQFQKIVRQDAKPA